MNNKSKNELVQFLNMIGLIHLKDNIFEYGIAMIDQLSCIKNLDNKKKKRMMKKIGMNEIEFIKLYNHFDSRDMIGEEEEEEEEEYDIPPNMDKFFFYYLKDVVELTKSEIDVVYRYGGIGSKEDLQIIHTYDHRERINLSKEIGENTLKKLENVKRDNVSNRPLRDKFKDSTGINMTNNNNNEEEESGEESTNLPSEEEEIIIEEKVTEIILNVKDLKLSALKLFKFENNYDKVECYVRRDSFDVPFLKTLKIRNHNIKEIPDDFGRIKQFKNYLEDLSLQFNFIRTIPESIIGCKSLSVLWLHSNFIHTCDPIGHLINLKILNLYNNKITKIPDTFSKLVNLVELYLNKNRIIDFSIICNLSNIESLVLSTNDIQRIPDDINNMMSLKKLDLEENEIKKIPNSIGSLTKLETLNLSINLIRDISPEVKIYLKSLNDLNLEHNFLDLSLLNELK